MPTQVQRRRGTTVQHAVFVGALGETTFDTTLNRPVVHNGATPGGFPAAMLHVANIFSETQTIFKQSADNTANGLDFSKRGTVGDANAAVISGVSLGVVTFRGWDTATLASGGSLRIATTEAWTPVAHGSQLLFQTVPIGSTTTTTHATLNSTAFTLAVPLNMGTHLINNVVNPVAAQDAATKAYVDGLVGAGAPPFTDTTPLVKGSADATKLMRFEVDGFTTATTRVLTPPNADITLAGINIAQTFAEDQTFGKRVLLPNTTSATVGGVYFGGIRAFHNFGTDNTFVGVSAGNLTLTGTGNSAFGVSAGTAITSGIRNSFFGRSAGEANTTGYYNSFFGRSAGAANIVGHDNAFFGLNAGLLNTANNNSFFGSQSGDANTTGTSNSFFGHASGGANLGGSSNSFFGRLSGTTNTSGLGNSFFGFQSGQANLTGNVNSFFGNQAGLVNTASYNSFFGAYAGLATTSGSQNCFSGFNAGKANITGGSNAFFGSQSGLLSTASYNSFFGRSAGAAVSSGANNSFFGHNAGLLNTTGANNSFFGRAAGDNLTAGALNIVLGANIDVPTSTSSNTLTIGNLIFGTGVDGVGVGISSGNVGIAVITPHSGLQVGRSFALPIRAVAATDTFAATDYTINANGTFTVNLPTAVGITGRIYVLKNSGVGTITLDPAGAELIDGLATATAVSGAAIMTQSTGTGWIII